MPEDINNPNWVPAKKFFPDAFLVALLTAVGYIAAFLYQYSYLKYFGAPIIFVDIGLNSVLLTTSLGLLTLATIGMFLNILFWSPKSLAQKFIKKASVFVLCAIVLAIFVPYYLLNMLVGQIVFGILLVGLLIFVYVLPSEIYPKATKEEKNGLLSKMEKIYGTFPVLFVVVLILFVAFSGYFGRLAAERQLYFLSPSDNSNLIVIGTYSGNFIATTINSETKLVNDEFFIISQDEISEKGIILKNHKIGPVKAK